MNKKYWLKFAIAFASVHTVLIIFAALIEFNGSEGCFGVCFGLTNIFGFMFFAILAKIGLLAGSDPQISPIIMSIVSIMVSFAFGSLIGLVWQPKKTKQENSELI